MKTSILFRAGVAASLLTIASSVPIASAEDEKEVKPATQVQVPAPTMPPEKVTPETQVKGPAPPVIEEKATPKTQVKGPAPPVVTPQVKLPTETPTNPDLQQRAMDEKQKAAAQGAMKTRAHLLRATLHFFTEPAHNLSDSPIGHFCSADRDSHGVVVRLRYEWRPTTSAQYLRDGLVVVRQRSGSVNTPVTLGRGSGEARTYEGGTFGVLPISLSRADVCPSGCTLVRLAGRTSDTKDRFDETWQRACLQWQSTPGVD